MASTTSATDAGSSSTWEGPSTSHSCATSGSCCCLCLCARSPFHFQGLDQGKSWSKFSASWPRWVGFPKQHLHALVDHAVWSFLCSKKNFQCWFFPNQTGEMLWLLKSVSFCPGGSGRYRAEALQEPGVSIFSKKIVFYKGWYLRLEFFISRVNLVFYKKE